MEHLATRTLHVSCSHPWETGTPELTHSANVLQSHIISLGTKQKHILAESCPEQEKKIQKRKRRVIMPTPLKQEGLWNCSLITSRQSKPGWQNTTKKAWCKKAWCNLAHRAQNRQGSTHMVPSASRGERSQLRGSHGEVNTVSYGMVNQHHYGWARQWGQATASVARSSCQSSPFLQFAKWKLFQVNCPGKIKVGGEWNLNDTDESCKWMSSHEDWQGIACSSRYPSRISIQQRLFWRGHSQIAERKSGMKKTKKRSNTTEV